MGKPRCFAIAALALLFAGSLSLSGCSAVKEYLKTDFTRLLAPEKVINSRSVGFVINPIYPSVGPADVDQDLPPNATFPREGDWTYTDEDYVIGPSDVINIGILHLIAEGVESGAQRVVSARGYIDLPLLPEPVKAEGLTKDQLKQAIINAYSPDLLRDPLVNVVIAGRRQSTFSILGAINRPNQYNIVRKNMRLSEALAIAGGVTQPNTRYIYVIRPAPAIRRSVAPPGEAKPPAARLEELPELPPEAPLEVAPTPEEPTPTTATQPAVEAKESQPAMDLEAELRELGTALPGTAKKQPTTLPAPSVMLRLTETETAPDQTTKAPTMQEMEKVDTSKTYKWVYTDGQWVRVAQEAEVAAEPSGRGAPPVRPAGQPPVKLPAIVKKEDADPFGWRKLDKSGLSRIIAIKLPELENGNQQMDIIVRDNDIIQVPPHKIGEFYVKGEVMRPGAYSLYARRITIKQAIAAAGNFGALAWPANTILYRRIGENQEQSIPLDLEAIFKGEEPDLFLKPNDVLAVGTNIKASFYAVMRNAFRITYGFGFLYDRNFADPYYLGTLDRKRFTRW